MLGKFKSSNLQFWYGVERSLFLFLNILERSDSRLEPKTDFHSSISRLMPGEERKRGDLTCFDIISNVSQIMDGPTYAVTQCRRDTSHFIKTEIIRKT